MRKRKAREGKPPRSDGELRARVILAIFQTGWYASAPGLTLVLALCGAVAWLITGTYPKAPSTCCWA